MNKELINVMLSAFGLEINEEFKLSLESDIRYKFTNNGLMHKLDNESKWEICRIALNELFHYEIIKLPFNPKYGDTYWSYWSDSFMVGSAIWKDNSVGYALLNCGCVFRTEDEAYKARPKKYAELTGKEWRE